MSLYNGFITNSKEFAAYLDYHCNIYDIDEEDRHLERDRVASIWNAALDAQAGLKLTKEEKIDRAYELDHERFEKAGVKCVPLSELKGMLKKKE